MYFVLTFLVYIFFDFIWLYSLLDDRVLFSSSGSKLRKYIRLKDPKNITGNFDNVPKNNKFKFLIFNNRVSPYGYKIIIYVIFVSIVILLIKLSFSYKFLVSNFLYVSIFGKNIDISSLLEENYITFKVIYYLSFFIFVNFIVYKLFKSDFFYEKILKKNLNISDKNELINLDVNTNEININIGESNDRNVILKEKGLYQNVLITGSIGSGKTSSAISVILDSFIRSNIYGLVIDVKGNYINTVKEIAKSYNKLDKVVEISLESDFVYNPLDNGNISNIELANRLKQVLILTNKNNSVSDPFWLDKAESIIRDMISLIRIYKGYVDFSELHKVIIDNGYLNKKIEYIKERVLNNELNDDEIFGLNSAISNIKNEYLKLDERTIGIIKAEVTRITNIFCSNSVIYNKFCKKGDDVNFLKDKIVVLSINIGDNKMLSQIISTYLKLDFQKQILSQRSNFKKVFFLCDEYQEFANVEDARFFSLSREYKCINVVSMQSYSSLINTLCNESATRVIIQNLVNKIWLRNDDMYTVSEIIKQVGKEVKNYYSNSYSENGRNNRFSSLTNKFKSYKSDLSESLSMSERIEYKYNEEYFTQKLKTFEAMCLISDGYSINLIEKVKLKKLKEDKNEIKGEEKDFNKKNNIMYNNWDNFNM